MTQIEEYAAKLAEQEAIIDRCRPRLDELKMLIGPWLRSVASGGALPEPVELRAEQAQLLAELWQARNIDQTRRDLGLAENHSRRLQEEIASYDAEIARLAALPTPTPARASRIQEEIRNIGRWRERDQRALDIIGVPRQTRQTLAIDAMKVVA